LDIVLSGQLGQGSDNWGDLGGSSDFGGTQEHFVGMSGQLDEFGGSVPDFVEDVHGFFGGLDVVFVLGEGGFIRLSLSLSGFFNQSQIVSVVGQRVFGGGQISLGSF